MLALFFGLKHTIKCCNIMKLHNGVWSMQVAEPLALTIYVRENFERVLIDFGAVSFFL